ncbi:DUF4012 domain-containing protein [Arenivirga flava]|uniref:Chemotaxis protein n=1 Tax=Arenivirga flava TaxID=1930060 RepID=A0AA37UFE6_9MICO|nr:DUF4012 domain-containing protein [Arenivirga flava]GMA28058.1 chemotaxis protein [Arenivirga flava]
MTAAIIIFVVVAWGSWVAVRGLLARDALQSAATEIRAAQASASLDALDELGELADSVGEKTSRAAVLTSDPLWRAAEVLPLVGTNLSAFRETAAAVDSIVSDALPSLVEVAGSIDGESLTLREGVLPVEELRAAQPSIGSAQAVVAEANSSLSRIQTEDVLPQIGEAVSQVRTLSSAADRLLTGLDIAARLLPPMLGASGGREYLVLFQNNAELRAGGGIPGATSVISADAGSIGLVDQASSADFRGATPEPVLPLSEEENSLFSDILGRFIQNATLTPDFARSGELAQARWTQLTGQEVDGVAAIDPVALSYLLEATGPVTLPDGSELTSENAVDTLLSGVYARFADQPQLQDAYFAAAAAAVFERVSSFDGDAGAMLDALARGVEERRILVWSANEQEQALLDTTPLAGQLPQTTEDVSAFGVYFNDATGAKMDYYVDAIIGGDSQSCRQDGRPEFTVGFGLTSSAPDDAAQSLTDYVTGGGVFGVEPGRIRTEALIYVPPGAVITGGRVNGEPAEFNVQEHEGRLVAKFVVELAPGESQSVQIDVLGDLGQSEDLAIEHTPMVRGTQVQLSAGEACKSDQG